MKIMGETMEKTMTNRPSKMNHGIDCEKVNVSARVEAQEISEKILRKIDSWKEEIESLLGDLAYAQKKMDRTAEIHAIQICTMISIADYLRENKQYDALENKLIEMAQKFDEVRKRDNVERLIREKHNHDDFFDLLIEVGKLAKEKNN